MKAHLQVISYNESRMVEPFLNWYSWCSSVTVYDNVSTDDTKDKFKKLRPDCQIIEFATDSKINNKALTEIKNTGWRQNRDNDWVIVVDLDEFLLNPFEGDIPKYLNIVKSRGISVVPSVGFNMFFDSYSSDFYKNFKLGSFNPLYGKSAIFDPKKVEDIGYEIGAHEINPKGDVKITQPHLFLLHCRYFGFSDWKLRNDEYAERVSHHIPGASFYIDHQNRILTELDYKNEFEVNAFDISHLLNLKGHRKK